MIRNLLEVIVVGAGPAGSIAAAILAQHGCRVLVVDKARFPRDKTCGDAIGWGSIKLLSDVGLSLDSEMPHIYYCDKVRLISPTGYAFEGSFPAKDGYHRHGYIIPRLDLDQTLWEFALQQGAEFEQLSVTEPIIESGVIRGVRGKVDGIVVERRGRITIAADGANSVIARSVRADKASPKHIGVAIRAYLGSAQIRERCMEFYFNRTDPAGYCWIFPLGEQLANIGVGLRLDALQKRGRSLRQALDSFISDPRLEGRLSMATTIGRAKGFPLPFATQRLRRVYEGALLVGDAGAFVSPFTGAGIYNALETGRIAAEVILKTIQRNDDSLEGLREFEVRWRSALGKKLKVEAILQKLSLWPGLSDLIILQMSHSQRLAQLILGKL